jgi:hypothetical protein
MPENPKEVRMSGRQSGQNSQMAALRAALGPKVMGQAANALNLNTSGVYGPNSMGLIVPDSAREQRNVSYWSNQYPDESMYVSFDEATPPASARQSKPVTLTRTPLPAAPADPFTETEREVFDKAKAVLGYKRPLKPEEKPLHKALCRLAIAPFDPKVVKDYKDSKESRGYISSTVWQRKPLDKYDGMVPEFALQRALDIKAECPKAKFTVDALTKVPDPFLVVTLGDEEFYVDVWLEPDFHAKRVW